MDEQTLAALAADRTIDITTLGRVSGEPRRIETWYHRVGGRYFLSGTPGPRDWYANLRAAPDFTFHLKETVTRDLPARARPVTEDAERRDVLREITTNVGAGAKFEDWVARSPLVEVTFTDETAPN